MELAATNEIFSGPHFNALSVKFSSGVTLRELKSIATVIGGLVRVNAPSRSQKRSLSGIVKWFADNWDIVGSVLPFIHLMDENGKVIDGFREYSEISGLDK